MATNKHAIIRYQALDKCFGNFGRRYYIDDLIKACNDAIYEYAGIEEGIKRRQIYLDIVFMESEQGWQIPLERIKDGRKVYFRYCEKDFSINNKPLTDSEVSQLKDTILMLGRFNGMPQFEWMHELVSKLEDKFHLKCNTGNYLAFDQNPYLKGLSYLSVLFNSITNQQTLVIEYKGYDKPITTWVIHPYYIKQYNNRWFLFGLNEQYNAITNLPLDRIESVAQSSHRYIVNRKIDFEEYFDDIIGVTIPPDGKLEKIVLRFTIDRLSYILSKPLHPSQKIKDKGAGLVEISVIPNKELESLILSFGCQVEVISPANFRDSIKCQIVELNNKYKSV